MPWNRTLRGRREYVSWEARAGFAFSLALSNQEYGLAQQIVLSVQGTAAVRTRSIIIAQTSNVTSSDILDAGWKF